MLTQLQIQEEHPVIHISFSNKSINLACTNSILIQLLFSHQ